MYISARPVISPKVSRQRSWMLLELGGGLSVKVKAISSHRLPSRISWEDFARLNLANSLKVLVPPGEFESPTS
jgi:hypothetical protein